MRINWKNIYGLIGIYFAFQIFSKAKPVASAYMESMADNHEFFDKHPALPFLAIAAMCGVGLAIAKSLSDRNK